MCIILIVPHIIIFDNLEILAGYREGNLRVQTHKQPVSKNTTTESKGINWYTLTLVCICVISKTIIKDNATEFPMAL